jgi:hypothetical protein
MMVKILRNTVIVLFLVIFVSVIYNQKNRDSDTESALISEATAVAEFKGVFVRDESPISYNGRGILSYSVPDGGKIESDGIIAVAYSDDSQIKRNREQASLEKELDILLKIQNPGTRESAQPSELSANISEDYREFIFCRDRMDLSGVKSVKDELIVEMSTYQIITNEVTDFSQQVKDIQTRLDQLKREAAKPIETVSSKKPGYFVSYCDGYEDKLTLSSLDTLTADQIEQVADTRVDDPKVVGKLISGYNWYLAGVVDNSRQEYKVGDYVRIRPESSPESFTAEIKDIRSEGDPKRAVLILACREFSSELVQHRCENIELIRGNYRGLKVPREAIRFVNEEVTEEGSGITKDVNYKGVYVLNGEKIEFKKIDVIYEGSDYVLSSLEHTGDESYLALYDDIMIEGVD